MGGGGGGGEGGAVSGVVKSGNIKCGDLPSTLKNSTDQNSRFITVVEIMWHTLVQQEELLLEANKKIKYRGTVRVQLKWLHFQPGEPRDTDIENVQRLRTHFLKDCRRLDVRNHIPALIDESDLNDAIIASGLSQEILLSNERDIYPELIFPTGYRLECLHGRHRVLAAKEALALLDKWWTVDLYLTGRCDHVFVIS